MPKPKPKTGEVRLTRHTFGIDRLPPGVHAFILHLRNAVGKTWQEIEDLSAEPVGEGKLGFVDWEKLPTPVLELFPQMRIPKSNLHRWYDVRVEQVARDVRNRSAQAREIAEAFAGSSVENADEAVINAARDTFMSVLTENSTEEGRNKAGLSLVKLFEVMQKAKANSIRERKVQVEEANLQIKLDQIKNKAGELLKAVEGEQAGQPEVSRQEIIRTVKDIYGVA